MIKIIKSPNIHMFDCVCGCTFTYENEDVEYDGIRYLIRCPYCNYTWNISNELTDIEKKEVFKRLKVTQ